MESASPRRTGAGSSSMTHVRYLIAFLLFVATSINYADRATISIAAPVMSQQLHISTIELGYIMSAFGWSYLVFQLPGGWLLDKFGSKVTYVTAFVLWSVFTFLLGLVDMLPVAFVVEGIFIIRLLIGAAEAPSWPANGRVVAAWFPNQERGTAAAVFSSAQYFGTAFFMPIMGWITQDLGWEYMFTTMGVVGIIAAVFLWKHLHEPRHHPRISPEELKYLEDGGAITAIDSKKAPIKWSYVIELFKSRMLIGVYIGQYAISCLTVFFLTWFPVYLVRALHFNIKEAGFIAPVPAICGVVGALLGGIFSDYLVRKTGSLALGRKATIIGGMIVAMSILFCNYTQSASVAVFFMALAFFGKGFGAQGWAVISDCAPKEIVGLAGGLFNMIGNISSIVVPITVGYLLGNSGDVSRWRYVFIFVAANALLAIFSFLFIVTDIKRFVIAKDKA